MAYENFNMNPTMQIPVSEFELDVQRGKHSARSLVSKFGQNLDIETAAPEVVWDGGATGLTFPTTAATLTIVSASAQDAAAGTGFSQIKIFGLDGNYNEINETVNMNGTNAVTTTNSYIRCFRAYGTAIGSGATAPAANAGNITIKHGSDLLAQITAGKGQTLMAVYTIPAGKSGYAKSMYASIRGGTSGRSADINMYIKDLAGVKRTLRDFGIHNTGNSFPIFPLDFSKIDEKTDIWVEANVSAAATDISAGFTLHIVDN